MMTMRFEDLKRVIAIDFDGCLFDSHFPAVGEPNWPVINKALKEQRNGAALILWTCREGEDKEAAVEACSECGLYFDAVNDNIQERIDFYGANTRKVFVDEYWDDRAVRVAVNENAPNDEKILEIKRWPSFQECGSKRTNIELSSSMPDWFVGYGKDESCVFEGSWWDMICLARNILANPNTKLACPEYYHPEYFIDHYTEPAPYNFTGEKPQDPWW